MRLSKLVLILFSVGSAIYFETLLSSTATGSFAVSSTVLSACVVATTPLLFGNYSAAQTDQTNTITVTCTVGTNYTLGLDAGTSTSATVTTRKMTGGNG